jgi:hypothetical protein
MRVETEVEVDPRRKPDSWGSTSRSTSSSILTRVCSSGSCSLSFSFRVSGAGGFGSQFPPRVLAHGHGSPAYSFVDDWCRVASGLRLPVSRHCIKWRSTQDRMETWEVRDPEATRVDGTPAAIAHYSFGGSNSALWRWGRVLPIGSALSEARINGFPQFCSSDEPRDA